MHTNKQDCSSQLELRVAHHHWSIGSLLVPCEVNGE